VNREPRKTYPESKTRRASFPSPIEFLTSTSSISLLLDPVW